MVVDAVSPTVVALVMYCFLPGYLYFLIPNKTT